MDNQPLDDTFAFIFHPIDIKRDVQRKYPFLGRILGRKQINFLSQFFPPQYISHIEGIVSADTQRELTGWFLAAPYTPPMLMSLPVEKVYKKIIACCEMAEDLGARIIGLGAYTSVVGDAGITIANEVDIPVTNGDSYTVFVAVEAVKEAARVMDVDVNNCKAAVVGATGAIGGACAELLANQVAELVLVGRRDDAVQEAKDRCEGKKANIIATTHIHEIYDADLVITVTSATTSVIEPEHLKPGAVVCDVARPRDVSRRVYDARDDVLVFEGGMVEVPGPVNFNFDFGFPPGKAFACMAETMILAMEGKYEDYSLGKYITTERALEIGALAKKHGFELSGFRSFEMAVSDEQINKVREQAIKNRPHWQLPQFGTS